MRHQDRCLFHILFQSHSLKTHLRITPSQAQEAPQAHQPHGLPCLLQRGSLAVSFAEEELLDEEDDEDDEEDLALLGMVAKVTTAVSAE